MEKYGERVMRLLEVVGPLLEAYVNQLEIGPKGS
jgi:hypothetical protein